MPRLFNFEVLTRQVETKSETGYFLALAIVRYLCILIFHFTEPRWVLCSWGHVTAIFLKIFFIMSYNLKNVRNGKKHIENTKLA